MRDEGHGGIESTLRNLRDKVWFPNMSKRVQEYVQSCLGCVAAVPFNPPAPITKRTPPSGPWKVCCADYKGPIGGPRGYYFHVLIDTYSKWPEVSVTKSTEFERLFPALDQSFACHGYPDLVVHDGGPPYNSHNWKEYAKRCGFETSLCTPEHPQANGQAEKFMSSIVKITHASIAEGKDPKKEIYTFLMNYRNTPHSSTGQTPASLMMNRGIKTKIPTMIKTPTTPAHKEARQKDAAAKTKQKEYADKHRRATDRQYKVGDTVLLYQKKSTTKPPYDPDPFTVTTTEGTKITATRRGKVVTRNVDKWKILKRRPHHLDIDKHTEHDREDQTDDDDDFDLPKAKPAPRPGTPPQHPQEEQEHEAPPVPPAGPPTPQAGQRGTPHRERWEVANGPWRQKQNSPSPRERKRRQGAAKRRSREQQGNYWLRSREAPEEGE